MSFHTDSSEIQAQLQQLRVMLLDIYLQDQIDEIRWIQSREFTTSTYYEFVQNYPAVGTSLSNLWKIKVPPMMSIFVCLMIKNIILMVDNLKRRGWQLVNIYHMWYNAEEIVHHLFIDCQFIREIHCYIHDVTQNYKIFFTNYRRGQHHFILDTTEDMH
jgi:zinc-binding in reverse transcriptase